MRAETARRVGASVVIVGAMLVWPRPVGERQNRSESRAISVLKAIAVAEIMYATVYGHYDTLDCLARTGCVPGRTADQDPFLSQELSAARNWYAYRIEFFPGPRSQDAGVPERSSSAMDRFAVTAVPVDVASAKRRAFCTDQSATIYISVAGTVPRVEDGRCLDVANPLR